MAVTVLSLYQYGTWLVGSLQFEASTKAKGYGFITVLGLFVTVCCIAIIAV